MNICDLNRKIDYELTGQAMHQLIAELYPICRSITGDGFRKTLHLIQQHIPLTMLEVPSGTQVFDWTVPKEWNIQDAYVKNSKGERVIDFQKSNLHVLNYSVPVHKTVSLEELKAHLFTLPDHIDWIPSRTSYYSENWGFCLSHKQFLELKEDEYEVCIDSSLEQGYLTYGEYYLPGELVDEVLISCHACHPSLCNDNLSGIALTTFLAKHLSSVSRRYSYRFLFIPATIGSITWLCLNEHQVYRIKHGLVVAGVGDGGRISYKKSRQGNAEIDRAVLHVLQSYGKDYAIEDFSPYGYDERQYCSPGFNLPIGHLSRTPFGQYAEYHTSADNLDFVQPAYLEESFMTYLDVIEVLEHNRRYLSTNLKCEPQLGKRGLYGIFGGLQSTQIVQMALLWVLNLSDGQYSLLDIAERSGISFHLIYKMAEKLLQSNLLKLIETNTREFNEIE